MTVPASITPRIPYTCNGATTDFPYPHAVYSLGDLQVVETVTATGAETARVLTTDWTVPETPDANGFYLSGVTVVANVAPGNGLTWTIIHDPVVQQTADLVDNNALPVEAQIETPLDRLTLMVSFIRSLVTRTLRQPNGDVAAIAALPAKAARASRYFGFDSNGDPTPLASPTGTTLTTAYSETLLAAGTAPAARATLGLPAIAAKGDLIAGSAADTLVKVAVGAVTGMHLVVDPAAAGGISWQHSPEPNPIINGSMDIWQRGTTFAPVANNQVTADRYKWNSAGTGLATVNRSTNVPTVAEAGVLFNYSLEVDVTTAEAALGVNSYQGFWHHIEGYNWRAFAQRALTLSFWVMSTKTGEHSLILVNSGTNRWLPIRYTVNASNTWEKKVISIPASPSAGTWDYTNGKGVSILFVLAVGSNFYTSQDGSWLNLAGPIYGHINQVNVFDSTANFFRITGIDLKVGTVDTPIEFMPFEQELARAMRYYQKSFPYATAPASNLGVGTGALLWYSPYTATTAVTIASKFPVPMRASPTVTTYNPFAAGAQARNTADGADDSGTSGAHAASSAEQLAISFTPNASNTLGDSHYVHWAADAEL